MNEVRVKEGKGELKEGGWAGWLAGKRMGWGRRAGRAGRAFLGYLEFREVGR